MRWVNRDGRQQWIDFGVVIRFDCGTLHRVELVHLTHADATLRQRGQQLLVPASVLLINKAVSLFPDQFALFDRGKTIRPALRQAIFNALQQAGDIDLKELVQVVGGYGEELDTLQQAIAGILRFLQDTPIEAEPGLFAIDIDGTIVERDTSHRGSEQRTSYNNDEL